MEAGRCCLLFKYVTSSNGSNLTHAQMFQRGEQLRRLPFLSPYPTRFFIQPLIKISLELGTRMRRLHEKRVEQTNVELVRRGIRDILNNC